MKKNFSNSEIFLPIIVLILSICSFVVLFSLGIFFYSKSASSEDISTEVIVYECGNNLREYDEVCDGTDLDNFACINLGYDFGNLSCESDCQVFNTSGCYFAITCGNDSKESGEFCDGSDLNNQSCTTIGYDGGNLSCSTDCQGFDTGDCYLIPEPTAVCGNSMKEIGEVCDNSDLNNRSCVSLGYDYGSLACNSSCLTFNTSGCKNYPSVNLCGNQAVDEGETCDGNGLKGETCVSLGYKGGTLKCNDTCSGFDASDCLMDFEICDNEEDDDANNFVDCFDISCMTSEECLFGVTELCYNNIDDDKNNFIDCYDAKCTYYEYCFNELTENCGNNLDDNGDGFVDCDDANCVNHELCFEEEEEEEEEQPPEELPKTGEEKKFAVYLDFMCLVFPLLVIFVLLILLLLLYRLKKEKEKKEAKMRFT